MTTPSHAVSAAFPVAVAAAGLAAIAFGVLQSSGAGSDAPRGALVRDVATAAVAARSDGSPPVRSAPVSNHSAPGPHRSAAEEQAGASGAAAPPQEGLQTEAERRAFVAGCLDQRVQQAAASYSVHHRDLLRSLGVDERTLGTQQLQLVHEIASLNVQNSLAVAEAIRRQALQGTIGNGVPIDGFHDGREFHVIGEVNWMAPPGPPFGARGRRLVVRYALRPDECPDAVRTMSLIRERTAELRASLAR